VSKNPEHSFITDLIQEECERDPDFRREYEAEKLADQLRRSRAANRITIESVAVAMKTVQPSISRLERKPEAVAFGRFLEYAHALGYEVVLKKSSTGPIAKRTASRAIPLSKRSKAT